MTPWGLRRGLRDWLSSKLLQLAGLDFDAAVAMEPEPPPAEDRVVPAPDDAPFLGADAMELLAKPRPTALPPPEPKPLAGSAEERVARTRPRW